LNVNSSPNLIGQEEHPLKLFMEHKSFLQEAKRALLFFVKNRFLTVPYRLARISRLQIIAGLGGVAKWSKATVCKTVIPGFESRRRLFLLYLYHPRAFLAKKRSLQNRFSQH
jgi:hypothetical protein